jgi:O-palmitoleoyl-L-serine hydrolase
MVCNDVQIALLSGEELDFIELLKSFGLDMSSMAQALGIDVDTLQNMEHKELLNLLTQQAN